MAISFGSDPEFMLKNHGKIKSAIGIIQGDPENRVTLQGHQFYADNVMAECAIKPARSKKKAIENFRECLQIYAKMAHPYRLEPKASHVYPDSELRHPMSRTVGCDPDYCAYEMKMKPAPKEAIQHSRFRSCGGHIHIGHPILINGDCESVLAVYMLDLILGVSSLWLDKDESSAARRGLYGQAGRHRPKDYGIEYRSLGNFWLKSPQLVALVFDLSKFVIEMLVNKEAFSFWSFDEEAYFESKKAWTCNLYDVKKLRTGIDTGNKKLVESHYKIVQSLLPPKLASDLESAVEAPEQDFYEAWGIA